MKRKNNFDRYKPDYEAKQNEWTDEAVNEKIMKKIDEMSDNISVPESLTPENMMKRINEAKKTDSRLKKKEKEMKRHVSKENRFYKKIIACGVSAAVVLTGIFTGIMCQNHSVEVKTGAGQIQMIKEQEKIETGTGTNKVLSASSREEIVGIIKTASMKVYSNKKSLKNSKDSLIKNETVMTEEVGNPGSSETAYDNVNGQSGLSDYYKNNDQVEGVVEADSVITDGKFIYSITENNRINIMSAAQGSVRNVSKIDFYNDYDMDKDGYGIFINGSKIFVNKDKVIVLFDYQMQERREDTEDYTSSNICFYYDCINSKDYTVIMQYDISDINHPALDNYHVVEGNMISSRLVDDYVYVVTSKNINMNIDDEEGMTKGLARIENDCIPKVDNEEIPFEKIYIADGEKDEYNYEIITSFRVGNGELKYTDNSAVLNNSGNVYVSNNNIYTMSEKWEEKEEAKDSGMGRVTQSENTKIYKFSYEKGNITPSAVGIVPGNVLNQFSLDEYNGYLRLVSTINEYSYDKSANGEEIIWDVSPVKDNALFVLDENLNICGSVENIAEGESIYSARFMGDYGYFVTFKQTDPLYVVDLSKPQNPVILDALKVTGFSNYLHPWAENVLLGVGEEADLDGRRTGVKIALFDISDKTNISEISKIVFDNSFSNDTIDYKRMMVAPEKSLFGIGIWIEGSEDIYGNQYCLFKYENGEFTNVFRYNYLGEESDSEDEYSFYDYRSLYIGDYLYIVTMDNGVISVNLNDYTIGEFVEFD